MRTHIYDWQPTGRVMRGPNGLFVSSPGDKFIASSQELPSLVDRLDLAAAALDHDPGCIEARLIIADACENDAYAMRHLENAVKAGKQLWEPIAAEFGDQMRWWHWPGTRPFMLAMQELAGLYHEYGNPEGAELLLIRLLAMDPEDHQGVSDSLAQLQSPAKVFLDFGPLR